MTSPDTALSHALFTPRSIGLIGLSDTASKPSGRPLRFLRRAGYSAPIYIVNPRRETVQGERAYRHLSDLPEVPEHVYILLGADLAEQAVADCAAAGVAIATLVADGFAEAGPEGRARQDRLVASARAGGMRLLGPNSMGVADLHSGCWLTVNAIYDEPDHLAGGTALFSQSGSMMGGLISRSKGLGLGFSRVAAVGNEADLGIAEIGMACLDDPNTDVFLLFLETIRDADALARFATAAHQARKPVIAYKLGRSALGQEMAVAHTGALLAEDAVADAFLRDIGIARVTTLDGLIEAPMLFRGRVPMGRTAPRLGVLTTTGGGGATVSDRLALEGIAIHPPSPATMAAVRATGLDVVDGPMVDLTMAGAGPTFVRPTIEAIAADPDVDMVVSITGSSARSAPDTVVPALIEADTNGKPLATFMTPDAMPALTRLLAAGVAAFRTPEGCADAVGAFCRWRVPRRTTLARAPTQDDAVTLDEAASLALLHDLGVPAVPSVALAIHEVGSAPLPFPYPVVAKVLSDAVPHKTEAGGVITGIASGDDLAAAAARIKTQVEARHPGLSVERLLIAPMIAPLQEVLIGYRLDPQVGPVITLAPGGILVGLYDDKAIRLAPVSPAEAETMIAEVRGLAALRGHRGLPKGDLTALAQAIAALSRLAGHSETILEAEANPVMVMSDGVMAVDALVTRAKGRTP